MTQEGFWGPPTSTIDWCEANYEHTPYVCELFNTVSSVAMVMVGLLGLVLHRRLLERRFLAAFLVVVLVGVGSIAFHATLRFELQLLDELPMLYSALILVYILMENQAKPRFGIWFPLALVAHGVLVTALTAFTRGPLQFYLFHASFGSLEFFALYRVFRLYRRSQSRAARRLFVFGMFAYASALVCWFTDLRACHFLSVTLPSFGVPNPQLHAIWHLLVSAGLYLLVVLIAHERLLVLGRHPRVCLAGGFLPYLRE